MRYLKIFEDYSPKNIGSALHPEYEITKEDVEKINYFYDLFFQYLEDFVLENFDLGAALTYTQPDEDYVDYDDDDDSSSQTYFVGYRFVNGYFQSDKIETFNSKISDDVNVDLAAVKSIYLSGVPKSVLKEMIEKDNLFKSLIKMVKYDDVDDFLTDDVIKAQGVPNLGKKLYFQIFIQGPSGLYPVESLNKKGLKSKYFTLKFYLDFKDIKYNNGRYFKIN